MILDPTHVEEEKARSIVTTATATSKTGVLTAISSGLMTEEQYFACCEACKRASESIAAFIRLVHKKKYALQE